MMTFNIWRSFQPRLSFPRPFQLSLACFRVARSPSNSWASCLNKNTVKIICALSSCTFWIWASEVQNHSLTHIINRPSTTSFWIRHKPILISRKFRLLRWINYIMRTHSKTILQITIHTRAHFTVIYWTHGARKFTKIVLVDLRYVAYSVAL